MAAIIKRVLFISLLLLSFMTAKGQVEWVDVNGVKWATCNVDKPCTFTAKPSELGKFYQWNRSYAWSSESEGEELDSSPNNSPKWEPVNNVCPEGWCLPTKTEILKLISSGSFAGTLDNVKGIFFAGKSGGEDKLLFFPYGTRASNGKLYSSKDTYGNIWAVSDEGDKDASYNMGYQDGAGSWSSNPNNRNMGFYIRCVKK